MVLLQITTIRIIGLYLIAVIPLVKSECELQISHIRYFGRPHNDYERDLILNGRKTVKYMECQNISIGEESLLSNLLNNSDTFFNQYDFVDKKLLPTITNISLVNSDVTLNSKTFQNFPNLTTLNLISNNISTFDMVPISSVRNLDLSHNLLTSLNNTNFQNFTLLSLNASYNQLSTIYCLNVSTEINLSHNQLSDSCKFAPTIEFIDFSYNNITYLSYYDFEHLEELIKLDLSYNNINYISSQLEGLIELRYINLSHNNIKNIYHNCFEEADKLLGIDLSYNRIENIEHGVTNNLGSLRYLNLSYNNIYSLDIGAVFYPMHNLRELKLEGNVLSEIDLETLYKLTQKLELISLSFSQISCNQLMNYIRELKNVHIKVLKGPVVYQHNVHGILCTPANNTSKIINNFEYAMYSAKKVHSLIIAISLFFIIILLMLFVINYYRYKNMRRF